MNSGETAYAWQLSAVTNIATSDGHGVAKTNYCKVSVISAPNGIVTKLSTEDSSGTGGFSACWRRYSWKHLRKTSWFAPKT